ncbi:peptidase MA family metallohydrolase, partial [bacterium]|nr:peptidase MA family metallohydrolase [bacterium]
ESFSLMEAMAQKALEENPNSVDALNVLAEISIIDANYPGAEEIVQEALKVNPYDVRSLANQASIRHLTGDREGYLQTEQTVTQINPACGEFYFLIADNCTKRFRYEDAVQFCYSAIVKDRTHWQSYALLGSNLLRTGKMEEARRFLDYGFGGDPFNLFARNTLELIDEYENFTVLESDHFSLLIQKAESDVLGKSMLAFAEECFDSLSIRYPYIPQEKIHIEAYNDHDDFAVRISGLPGIGLLGVCFGDVVALDTPRAQADNNYNWAQTLWHELAHVMALGISNHRVPRWFTEGLSVYEEMRARPQWGRKMELQLFYALDHGLLLPLSDIDKGFTRPQFPEQVLLTYFQSAKYIEFLVDRFGFDAVVDILRAFADGQSTEEAFHAVLDLSLEETEHLLLEDLQKTRDRYAAVLSDLPPLFSLPEERQSPPRVVTSETQNPFFKAIYEGMELLEKERSEEAEQKFLSAVELFPLYTSTGNPYEALATIYRHNNEESKLVDILIRYLAITEYGAQEAKELGRIFENQDNLMQAETYYRRSLQVDPYDIDIRLQLAELYKEGEDYGSEIDERKAILALEPVDRSDAQYRLALSLYHDGKKSYAKMEVLKALDLAPGFRDAQRLLLQCVDNSQ